MKKLVFIVILTLFVITACNFNKPEIITYFDKGYHEFYSEPVLGQVGFSGPVRHALSHYKNKNVRYFVNLTFFDDITNTAKSLPEREKITEYQRLLKEGYDLYKGKDWTYKNRLEKKYFDVYFLLLTKEEIETFKANKKYAYIFDFARDGLFSPIEFKDCKKVKLSDLNLTLPQNVIASKIDDYYRTKETDDILFLNIKVMKRLYKNYLILADMHATVSEYYSDLFIADENCNLMYKVRLDGTMDSCFLVNQVYYDNKTILFGAFNDIKWILGKDENEPVEIDKVYVKLKSGAELKEKIDYRQGCILVLDEKSPVETFEIYNRKNKLQAKSDSKINFKNLTKID